MNLDFSTSICLVKCFLEKQFWFRFWKRVSGRLRVFASISVIDQVVVRDFPMIIFIRTLNMSLVHTDIMPDIVDSNCFGYLQVVELVLAMIVTKTFSCYVGLYIILKITNSLLFGLYLMLSATGEIEVRFKFCGMFLLP